MSKDALREAVEVLGSQTALAAACGPRIKQGHVYYWLRQSKNGLPPHFCDLVARATREKGREISPARLRPDVFGVAEAESSAQEAV